MTSPLVSAYDKGVDMRPGNESIDHLDEEDDSKPFNSMIFDDVDSNSEYEPSEGSSNDEYDDDVDELDEEDIPGEEIDSKLWNNSNEKVLWTLQYERRNLEWQRKYGSRIDSEARPEVSEKLRRERRWRRIQQVFVFLTCVVYALQWWAVYHNYNIESMMSPFKRFLPAHTNNVEDIIKKLQLETQTNSSGSISISSDVLPHELEAGEIESTHMDVASSDTTGDDIIAHEEQSITEEEVLEEISILHLEENQELEIPDASDNTTQVNTNENTAEKLEGNEVDSVENFQDDVNTVHETPVHEGAENGEVKVISNKNAALPTEVIDDVVVTSDGDEIERLDPIEQVDDSQFDLGSADMSIEKDELPNADAEDEAMESTNSIVEAIVDAQGETSISPSPDDDNETNFDISNDDEIRFDEIELPFEDHQHGDHEMEKDSVIPASNDTDELESLIDLCAKQIKVVVREKYPTGISTQALELCDTAVQKASNHDRNLAQRSLVLRGDLKSFMRDLDGATQDYELAMNVQSHFNDIIHLKWRSTAWMLRYAKGEHTELEFECKEFLRHGYPQELEPLSIVANRWLKVLDVEQNPKVDKERLFDAFVATRKLTMMGLTSFDYSSL